MKDEMQDLARRIATGRKSPKRMVPEVETGAPNKISPDQMKRMKRMGSRMSDRLITRFR